MVISSTRLPKKDIYKHTWTSPGGRCNSQIDHVVIDKRHKSSITNVRSYRGADADTDHYLVISDFKVKLSARWSSDKPKGTEKIDVDRLKNEETCKRYEEKIEEKLKCVDNCKEEQIDEKWKRLKDTVIQIAESVVQTKQRKKIKPWFNELSRKGVQDRNDARMKAIQTPTPDNIRYYEIKRKEVNKILRREKRRAEKMRIEEIEKYRGNPKEFYKYCKTFKMGYIPNTQFVEDEEGEIITSPEKIAEKYKEYFEKLLNNSTVSNEEINKENILHYTVEPEVRTPNWDEIQSAINTLKNNKAPGDDKINAELWKAGGRELKTQILKLIQQIWKEERIPENWNESLICPIYKKGDRKKVENYRGISLLNTGYKILALVILNRLQEYSEGIIGDYQSGFRMGRSTIDHVFVIRQIMEHYYEYARDLHMIFVDYKQAYDSIIRKELWRTLAYLEIPKKLITLIQMCNADTYSRIKFKNVSSHTFKIENGLCQGDAMSPVLFNLAIESVIRKVP